MFDILKDTGRFIVGFIIVLVLMFMMILSIAVLGTLLSLATGEEAGYTFAVFFVPPFFGYILSRARARRRGSD